MSEEEHKQRMVDHAKGSIRKEPFYLSNEVSRCLFLICKAKEITADELADTMLREHINGNYPDVVAHLMNQNKEDRHIIKKIGMAHNDS